MSCKSETMELDIVSRDPLCPALGQKLDSDSLVLSLNWRHNLTYHMRLEERDLVAHWLESLIFVFLSDPLSRGI